jgi:hypothetical protein
MARLWKNQHPLFPSPSSATTREHTTVSLYVPGFNLPDVMSRRVTRGLESATDDFTTCRSCSKSISLSVIVLFVIRALPGLTKQTEHCWGPEAPVERRSRGPRTQVAPVYSYSPIFRDGLKANERREPGRLLVFDGRLGVPRTWLDCQSGLTYRPNRVLASVLSRISTCPGYDRSGE